ncbi:MAG: carboxypeptidase-like regulatory domain-containing protein [Candidatus Binataceae bacterium]
MKVIGAKRWRKWNLAMSLLIIAGLYTPAFAASIAGIVTNAAGRPIDGADIAAQNSSTAVVVMMVSTDHDGTYCLSDLAAGSYDIVLELTGAFYLENSMPARKAELMNRTAARPTSLFSRKTPSVHLSSARQDGPPAQNIVANADWYDAGTVEAYVGSDGLALDWTVAPSGFATASVESGFSAARIIQMKCHVQP